ncbi:hypothetical protein JTB14_014080 [Gonioctena quinquepunctata]|nr:hypothetical protein JTB14_014080 [Gonioctena quinquepunctata]
MVIDESMIPWRGKLKFRQYIPTESHKYGVKLFELCSPSDYTWKCQIYTERTEEQRPAGLGIGETVVLALTERLLDEGRTLYMNNFYTSCPLAEIILTESTHLVGTRRRSRKHLPKDVKTKKLKKHEYIGQETNDGIVVSKWKDARDVLMLSTLHGLEMKVPPPSKRKIDDKNKKKVELDLNKENRGNVGSSEINESVELKTVVRKNKKTSGSSENEEWHCIICDGNAKESMIQCIACEFWIHDLYAGVNKGTVAYQCDNCSS